MDLSSLDGEMSPPILQIEPDDSASMSVSLSVIDEQVELEEIKEEYSRHSKGPSVISFATWSQTDSQYSDPASPDARKRKRRHMSEQYNPYRTPPDFKVAETHAKATLVNDQEEDEEYLKSEKWPWCNYPTKIKPYNICKTSPTYLGQLGCGFTLYYMSIKALICIMLACFAISFFALYDNYTAGKEHEWDEDLEGHWLISGTIAAHGTDSHPSIYQAWLNSIQSWVCLVIYVIVHLISKDKVQQLYADLITPADFTLYVLKIPKTATEDNIEDWVRENGTPEGMSRPIIHKVSLIYDSSKYEEYGRKHEIWRTELEHAPEESGLLQHSKQQWEAKMDKAHKKLRQIEEDVKLGKAQFTGKALITFEYEHEAALALETLNQPIKANAWWHALKLLCGFFGSSARTRLLGQKVIVQRAEEPEDFVWQNLAGNEMENYKTRFKTGLVTFGLLAICFCVIMASAQWKKYLQDQTSSDPSQESKNKTRALTLIPPIFIVLVNGLLCHTIKYFTNFEKYDTKTDYESAVAIKLTTALFINTAIICFIVYRNAYYGQVSLIVEVTAIIFMNAILGPFIQLFRASYILRRIRQWNEKRKGNKSKLTQQEANDLFQGPQKDMALRYSYRMKTYLLVMMYGPILPIAYPITAIVFFVEYWIDKYILLRRNCRPPNIGKNLNVVILKFIPIGIFLNCIGSMIFHYNYNSDTMPATVTGLIISFVFLLTPWVRFIKLRLILKKAHVIKSSEDDNLSQTNLLKDGSQKGYEDYKLFFKKDYDRENPLGGEEANRDWKQKVSQATAHGSVIEGQATVETFPNKLDTMDGLLDPQKAQVGPDNRDLLSNFELKPMRNWVRRFTGIDNRYAPQLPTLHLTRSQFSRQPEPQIPELHQIPSDDVQIPELQVAQSVPYTDTLALPSLTIKPYSQPTPLVIRLFQPRQAAPLAVRRFSPYISRNLVSIDN